MSGAAARRGERSVARAAGWAAALALAGVSAIDACGGTTGAPMPGVEPAQYTDPGSGPVSCDATDGISFLTIEDFESGAATGWYTNTEFCLACQTDTSECLDSGTSDVFLPGRTPDGHVLGYLPACSIEAQQACVANCEATQRSPSYLTDPLQASPIANGGRCGSQYAMHVVAGPFMNWGGSLGRRFATACPDGGAGVCGIDASQYDGVALWMRTAPGNGSNPVGNVPRVIVADRYTDTSYNQLLAACGGSAAPRLGCPDYVLPSNYCDPNPPPVTPTGMSGYSSGCDKFGSYATMTGDWQLFLLPFSEMRQGGWGRQEGQLDTSGILSMEIDYSQNYWDFWIDDVAFYKLNHP